MIELSAQAAAMLYLMLTLGSLLSLWVYQHIKGKTRKILPEREILCRCEYCLTAYMADPLKKVNQCPECKSFNKENRFHSSSQKKP